MAAEAAAQAGSPRRAALAAERASGSVAAFAGNRGSDGSLLRSVRRKRVTTASALATVSVTG
ncbi:hypothetical protein KCW65_25470, partial [Mycobacterium tuberculosis]|nr:hypothetical protein [Mycobacterium tuberculosis]